MISGFTFVHNALEGGYPIAEAIFAVRLAVEEMVVVDMASTDGTSDVLRKMQDIGVVDTVLQGVWVPGDGGKCLAYNYSLNARCKGDIIVHFEADEVWDPELLSSAAAMIKIGGVDVAVWRLQVEQNFQRVRWYPTLVHRIFPKGTTIKQGETSSVHRGGERKFYTLPPECGFLWDVTNCFRDNWIGRARNNAILWGSRHEQVHVPVHIMHVAQKVSVSAAPALLEEQHWTWKRSPFDLPEILRPLVGMTKYEVRECLLRS